MIKSVFHIIWLRRKQNFLLFVELFVSFLFLFALLIMLITNIVRYLEPLGYKGENVLVVNMDIWSKNKSEEENKTVMEQLRKNILSLPEILALTNCSENIPYSNSTYSSGLEYKNIECRNPNRVKTDDDFYKVMNITIKQGRWYTKEDEGNKEIPIVINQKLKDILFQNESAIGKVIHSGAYKVVGIIDNYKIKGEFSKEAPVYFTRFKPNDFEQIFLIKVKEGTSIAFESRLMQTISTIAKNWTIRIKSLDNYRRDNFKLIWIPIIVFSFICAFFILNIILGLFGILWYNISQRKSEIGLRQAVGATKGKIYQQFIGEMIALATLGIIPGLIIAVQFPILNVFDIEPYIYLISILAAISVIYVLVILCALLPSAQAAKIQPAAALHED